MESILIFEETQFVNFCELLHTLKNWEMEREINILAKIKLCRKIGFYLSSSI